MPFTIHLGTVGLKASPTSDAYARWRMDETFMAISTRIRRHLRRAVWLAHPLRHADELRRAARVRRVAHGPLARLQLSQRSLPTAHGRSRCLSRAARRQPRRGWQQVTWDPHWRRRRALRWRCVTWHGS